MSGDDLFGGMSLLDLFRTEVATHVATLSAGLLALEREPGGYEGLMRAAHSIKGAARIVAIEPAVRIAHALEECFVAAQRGEVTLGADDVDLLLRGTDHLEAIGVSDEAGLTAWAQTHADELRGLLGELRALAQRRATAATPGKAPVRTKVAAREPATAAAPAAPAEATPTIHDAMREAVRTQTTAIDALLAGLPTDEAPLLRLERLVVAVQAMHGALRPIGLEVALTLTAAMEATLLAAEERRRLPPPSAEIFAAANRALAALARLKDADLDTYAVREGPGLRTLAGKLDDALRYPDTRSGIGISAAAVASVVGVGGATVVRAPETPAGPAAGPTTPRPAGSPPAVATRDSEADRYVRVATASINKLLGLAGESVVEAQRIGTFMLAMEKLRAQEASVVDLLDRTLASLRHLEGVAPSLPAGIDEARARVMEVRSALGTQRSELEAFARRADDVSSRLYREAVSTRMRPLSDGVHGFPRLVRDLARKLGRQVELVIEGESVRVDRDVLDRIESPLNHMLRNAVDHGVESIEERRAAGKSERGTIRLEARHTAGALSLVVADDGRGIDTPKIRRRVAERGLLSAQAAEALSEAEAVEYIFVPGFSTADAVTDVSGRGVGLDVVRTTVQELGGSCRTITELGRGTTFLLQLPLTLSVTRAVVVEIAGDPYAFPLLRIDRLVRLPVSEIRLLENRQYFHLDGRNVGLVRGRQIFELDAAGEEECDELDVVVVSDRASRCGVVVDGFLGEQDLVVQPLDPRLGRVADISSSAITASGRPLLIVDVEDMVRSVARLFKAGLTPVLRERTAERRRGTKRILVVDDSITVREVHRQLLTARGFEVVVAEDGMVGWQAVREGGFDLVISDVDMPRMNGIELVRSIKQDAALRATPVMIVSYKESPEDRARGLEAGANFYITKSDFHDETFLTAVVDLAGEPMAS